MVTEFLGKIVWFCNQCVYSTSSEIYIAYALLVLAAGFIASRINFAHPAALGADGSSTALVLGEFGRLDQPKKSIQSQAISAIVSILSVETFFFLIDAVVSFVKKIANITEPRIQMRTFVRFLNFYFIVIPLPASFMPPVPPHVQRPPDAILLSAVVLLIITNAIGDVFSFNLTIWSYTKFENRYRERGAPKDESPLSFYRSLWSEAVIYYVILRGAAYSLLVLIIVLTVSSVLFGVQVGECTFALTSDNALKVLDRMRRFPELAGEMYWFKAGGPAPFGLPGIPGIFIYGMTTFLPTILMLAFALVWLLALPLRIALFLPANATLRVLISEITVLALCSALSYVFGINISVFDVVYWIHSL